MYVYRVDQDVAFVHGWYKNNDSPEQNYKNSHIPKVPLLLAALTTVQAMRFASILKEEQWQEVGWYPSCHCELDTAHRVILYKKEQDVPLLPPAVCPNSYKNGGFNEFIPLGCSAISLAQRSKLTPVTDMHRTLGLHRRETKKPVKLKVRGNWRFFAQTELASYWYWGLAPDETNRHKYEKEG